MELLFSKFTAVAQRHGLPKYFVQLGRASVAAVKIMGTLTASLVGLLAASAETSDEEENDVSAAAFRGGVLNYRTGKLDDGTDPYGWYEED